MTHSTHVALFVELKAKAGKEAALAAFLESAQPLAVAERETTAWFAVRFDVQTFAIFDAFETQSGREAHLAGPIAAALMAQAADLLITAPQIRRADVVADKIPGQGR
jgi:quinol monooxygenase YgiN